MRRVHFPIQERPRPRHALGGQLTPNHSQDGAQQGLAGRTAAFFEVLGQRGQVQDGEFGELVVERAEAFDDDAVGQAGDVAGHFILVFG